MAEASGRIRKIIDSDEDFEKEMREAGDKLVVVEFFSEEYVLYYGAYLAVQHWLVKAVQRRDTACVDVASRHLCVQAACGMHDVLL